MDFEIEDVKLRGFNEKAKEKLSISTQEFINDLIEESNRIESGTNTTGGEPECCKHFDPNERPTP